MKNSIRALLGVAACALMGAAQAQTVSITRVTAYDYDSKGNPVKEIVEPDRSDLCVATVFQYDPYGNRTETTQRNCNGSVGSVPGANNEAAAPAGDALFTARTSLVEYGTASDPRLPSGMVDALSRRTTVTFSKWHGKQQSSSDPNNATQLWLYDSLARPTQHITPDSRMVVTEYRYCQTADPAGEACPQVNSVSPYYVVVQYTRLAANATPIGPTTRTYLDGVGRSLRVETQGFDGNGASRTIYTDTVYDHLGRTAARSLPYHAGESRYDETYTYGLANRVDTITARDGSVTTFSYSGLTTSVTNALGQSTTTTRNDAGWVTAITDATGNAVTHTYDPFGNLTATVDALGNRTVHTYDATGRRRTSTTDPDRGRTQFVHDALGQKVVEVDNKNQRFTFSYDVLGRLQSAGAPDLIRSFAYDNCANGIGYKCSESSDNGYTQTFSYDAAGRLTGRSAVVDGATYSFAYQYDANSRLARQDYPGGFSTTYAYTALGYMKEVRNTATPSLVYWRADAADALGHITQQTLGNQVVGTDVYDGPTGRLMARRAGAGDGVMNLTLTYDALGNLKTRHDGNLGNWASYTYDALNRLRTEDLWGPSFGGTQSIAWTYDAIGNISSRSDVGIYSYPASGAGSVRPHAVAGIAGTVNGMANPGYSYDANGNLTSGAGRTITWTSHDLPATITQGSNSLEYLYRADLGRLHERLLVNGSVQRSTLYLHPGNAGALEYEQESGADGVKHRYFVTAQGRAVAVVTQPAAGGAPSTRYLHNDQLGSVAVVTGEAGGVVERLQYEPFGKRRLPSMQTDAAGTWRPQSTDRGFTGHEHLDEVGLVHMNGRVYDPAIGRFVSADPTDFSGAGDMQALNGYAYVRNNPLALVDPTGYEDEAAGPTTLTMPTFTVIGCPGCTRGSSGDGTGPGLRANFVQTDSGDGVSRFQLAQPSPEGLVAKVEPLPLELRMRIREIVNLSLRRDPSLFKLALAQEYKALVVATEGQFTRDSTYQALTVDGLLARALDGGDIAEAVANNAASLGIQEGAAASVGLGLLASRRTREIALGKDIPGAGLKALAESTGASWYRNWARDGITRRSVTSNFGRAFHQAADRADRIHFSLDGISDPSAAVKAGSAGFVSRTGNMTNAELHYIANNPSMLEKTTFYRNGQVVPSPF